MIEIENGRFINNTAQSYGGSVFFTPGVTATIDNSYFENTNLIGPDTRPKIGNVIIREVEN